MHSTIFYMGVSWLTHRKNGRFYDGCSGEPNCGCWRFRFAFNLDLVRVTWVNQPRIGTGLSWAQNGGSSAQIPCVWQKSHVSPRFRLTSGEFPICVVSIMDSSQEPDGYRRFGILWFLLKHMFFVDLNGFYSQNFKTRGLNQVSTLFDPRLFNSLAGLAEIFVWSSQS